MIKVFDEIINKTIDHLNKNYPVNDDVYIHICEGYDVVETPEGTGFGVFVPSTKDIYIAAEVPEPELNLIKNIAHEYKHFMQMCNGEEFDEDEAELFSEKVVAELLGGAG